MPPALVLGANEYRLTELMAATPLGGVYRAQHIPTGRFVAVRLLQTVAASDAALAAFQREMPAIARLHHPRIVRVEGWGETDGVPYVAGPLPDAGRLSDLLDGGWSPDRAGALQVLRGVAGAVDHAHRLGIVHGALEPAAVLVTNDGSALVGHFGIARLAGALSLVGGTSAAPGMSVAPERARGEIGTPGDVFAFAALAERLLSGTGPLSSEAGAALRRGLDPDPGARWSTCRRLLVALEPGLGPMPAISIAPVAWRRRQLGGWRSIAIGAALVVVLGSALAASAVIAQRARLGQPVALERSPAATPTPIPFAIASPSLTPEPTPSPEPSATPSPTPTTQRPAPVAAPKPPTTPAPTPVPTPTPSSSLGIAVSDSTPGRGDFIIVVGHGYDPHQQYVIDFVQGSSRRRVQGPASPRGNGDFFNPVQIPTNAQLGQATLIACVSIVNQGPTSRCAQVGLNVHS